VEGLDKLCLGLFDIIAGCEVYSDDGSACETCDSSTPVPTTPVPTVNGDNKLCLAALIADCGVY
jgi:hypothetical protein